MSCYEISYVAYHTVSALLVPTVAVLAFTAPLYVTALVLGSVVLLRLRCCRVRVRTGFSCGKAPRTEAEVVALFREDTTLTPVGSAWDAYLHKRPVLRPVHMHLFCNSAPLVATFENVTSRHWWKAGSTIDDIATFYAREGKAFGSLPSLTTCTLGAWIWSGSHGTSGDDGVPSNSAFAHVRYVDFAGSIRTVQYKVFDKHKAVVILYVSFDPSRLEENMWLHKRALFMDPTNRADTEQKISEWLRPSYQRAIFVGKYVLGLQWTREQLGDDVEHEDPHCCSRLCLWVQADACNASCGCCLEPARAYASRVRLCEVNQFVPTVWRFPVLSVMGCGYYNCEIICRVPQRADTIVFLQQTIERCHGVHALHGGRTEIRFTGSIVFVDVAMRGYLDAVFLILEDLGVQRYALHEGKYPWTAKTRMVRVTPAAIYKEVKTYSKEGRKNLVF